MSPRAEDFDYALPDDLIAQRPIEPRSAARLLVDRGTTTPADLTVSQLPSLLRPGDLLVVNDTRVIPARVHLQRRSGGAVEVLLLERSNADEWTCLLRPARRIRDGESLVDASGRVIATVKGRTPGDDQMTFVICAAVSEKELFELGEMPLPPYIASQPDDPSRYQTVYAQRPASAAAPTAGLHFTTELLSTLRAMDVTIAPVELVVGLDTFRPLSESDLSQHQMHTESYRVPESTMALCRSAERVVAVGTTATRALESAALRGELEGRTDLFITPGHHWQIVDVLMTNFHMPRTTLLVMIEALVGPRWRELYAHAIAQQYRFLSFGDAMLLDRHLNHASHDHQ